MIANQFGKTLVSQSILKVGFRVSVLSDFVGGVHPSRYTAQKASTFYEVLITCNAPYTLLRKRAGESDWGSIIGLPTIEVLKGIQELEKDGKEVDLEGLWLEWNSIYDKKLITDKYSDWHINEALRANGLQYNQYRNWWEGYGYVVALEGDCVSLYEPGEIFSLPRNEAAALLNIKKVRYFHHIRSEWKELSRQRPKMRT